MAGNHVFGKLGPETFTHLIGSRNSFLGRHDKGAQFALLVFAVQGHHGSAYPGMRG
jgi:hypothetical protein